MPRKTKETINNGQPLSRNNGQPLSRKFQNLTLKKMPSGSGTQRKAPPPLATLLNYLKEQTALFNQAKAKLQPSKETGEKKIEPNADKPAPPK